MKTFLRYPLKRNPAWPCLLVFLLYVCAGSCKNKDPEKSLPELEQVIARNRPATDWKEYNGDGSRSHYTPLAQVTKENVHKLKVAWTYASAGTGAVLNGTQMQCNPVVVDGVLYGVSASTQAFALDAATGRQIWKTAITDNGGTTSRGVTYCLAGAKKLLFFGAGRWLYALDAKTGQAVTSFGDSGRIDLKKGITRPDADNYVVSNTPNTIYKDLVIVGTRVSEEETALLGDIRAYNVFTGRLVWTFKTIPEPGQPGYSTWSPAFPRTRLGGANAWAGMAIDRARGIVFAPTGSAAYDFYGGNRKGNNLFANCLLALDAATGRLLWHFQLVHHDIWDRDPPAPPNLVTVMHNGVRTDAVAQLTKQGFLFLFDRTTGQPLFNIIEKKVRTDGMPGEAPSATQPFPSLPAPFTRQEFTQADFSPFVSNRDSLAALLRGARNGGAYVPVGKEMTIFFPGTDGGAQWGGAAADPGGTIYIPAKQLPVYTSLKATDKINSHAPVTATQLYIKNCSACHGEDRQGNHDGSYPSLVEAEKKYRENDILQLLEKGRGMMPSFSHLSPEQRNVLASFILNKGSGSVAGAGSNLKMPYHHTGYNRWYSGDYPVSMPPWGTLTAIDLNTGARKWQVPLGEYKRLTEKGIAPTGTDNYGGPLVTGSGLLFIAASRDEKFRAFDKNTGKIVWETTLPAAGYASPSAYAVKGRQYIVIACGGGKLKTKPGDKYVAFCLDE